MGRRRKVTVLAAGALALAGALTTAAIVAPHRIATAASTYVPRDPAHVVATVPARDPQELADRRLLATSPDDVAVAVELARTEITRARTLSDPRHLGRAQAVLARWWGAAAPPPDVLLLRATIRQALHQFSAARADLDQLIAQRPEDVDAHLTRAVVATVTADYPAARASCTALAAIAAPIVAAACMAPLTALAGDIDGAYRDLAATLDGRTPVALRSWALTTLAELAIQRGDDRLAATHLRSVLALDPRAPYARAALADILDPGAASALLTGFEPVDNLLVRRAIAEHAAGGPLAASLAAVMQTRIDAAATRGDSIHQREEAMFALGVTGDATRAVELAAQNWDVQKELADARLLVDAALAARRPSAAAPVIAWARATGVRDARLDRALAKLGGM